MTERFYRIMAGVALLLAVLLADSPFIWISFICAAAILPLSILGGISDIKRSPAQKSTEPKNK